MNASPVFILAAGWLVHLAKQPSGRAIGFGATVLLGTIGGLGVVLGVIVGGGPLFRR